MDLPIGGYLSPLARPHAGRKREALGEKGGGSRDRRSRPVPDRDYFSVLLDYPLVNAL